MKPVIICGGVGSKMWPASRQKSPKHFLKLIGDKSLFQINYELLRQKFKAEEIYVSTNQGQAELVKKFAPDIPQENYFLEPELRNTGPAIGFIAAKLWKYKDEPFMVVQSDILRQPEDKFLEMIDLFDAMMKKSDEKWITGAIKPPFAMMGVDYMISENGTDLSGWMISKEKGQVESYINDGKAWLHANHYCWTPKKWLESYQRFKPEWYEPLMKIAEGGDEKEIYPQIPKGRTEEWTEMSVKAGEGMMIPVPFEWWDFGTWESVFNYLGTNPSGPVDTGPPSLDPPEAGKQGSGKADVIEIDSKDNFVRMPSGKMIATIGVENLIIVDTGDAILICRKDQSGRVGEVVERLKAEGKTELL